MSRDRSQRHSRCAGDDDPSRLICNAFMLSFTVDFSPLSMLSFIEHKHAHIRFFGTFHTSLCSLSHSLICICTVPVWVFRFNENYSFFSLVGVTVSCTSCRWYVSLCSHTIMCHSSNISLWTNVNDAAQQSQHDRVNHIETFDLPRPVPHVTSRLTTHRRLLNAVMCETVHWFFRSVSLMMNGTSFSLTRSNPFSFIMLTNAVAVRIGLPAELI